MFLTAQLLDINPKVKGVLKTIQNNIDGIPYSSKINLTCKGPGIVFWIHTDGTIDLGTGLTPRLNANASIYINHFNILKNGFYMCKSNVSTFTYVRELVHVNTGTYSFFISVC